MTSAPCQKELNMFAVSEICHAFRSESIGTKVIDYRSFMEHLKTAINQYKFPANGQGFINLDNAISCVSCGIAKRPGLTAGDLVIREWRGDLGLYARRKFAEKAKSLNVVVYTLDAYKSNPQISAAELAGLIVTEPSYVIVAVLAAVEQNPPVGVGRFVRNLAGGNASYTADQGYTLDKAKNDAKRAVDYENEWITVAD